VEKSEISRFESGLSIHLRDPRSVYSVRVAGDRRPTTTSVDRLRVHARFLRSHASRYGSRPPPFGWRRRGERGRSQLAEADLRARCKAEAHLFHERRPRRAVTAAVYPYWIINLAGWLLGSAVLHRPGPSRKPYTPRESACFVAAHAGPRVARARARDDIEIDDRRRNRGRGISPTRCGFAAVAASLLCGKRVAGETRRATCLSEFPIAPDLASRGLVASNRGRDERRRLISDIGENYLRDDRESL
jgi:hypothetical protein